MYTSVEENNVKLVISLFPQDKDKVLTFNSPLLVWKYCVFPKLFRKKIIMFWVLLLYICMFYSVQTLSISGFMTDCQIADWSPADMAKF